MTMMVTGGFVRHRDRMVQESVIEDLENTLIACRWKSGTTTHKVIDPYNPSAGWTHVTTTPDKVLRMAGVEVKVIDYFPESSGPGADVEGASRTTEPNTLAVDSGVAGESYMVELGSNLREQPYAFTMALFARTDAVALALFNDLRDRYQGRLITSDHISLYNFNADDYDPDTSLPVSRMEVDAFRYAQDASEASPSDVHLYYAELQLTDVVDAAEPAPPIELPPVNPGFDTVGFDTTPFGP